MKSLFAISVFAVIFSLGIISFHDAYAANMTFSTDTTISASMTIADGETWTVNNGVTLTINPAITIVVEDGGSINNNGIIFNSASISNRGVILNSNLIINTDPGTIVNTNSIVNTGIIENIGTINFASFGKILNSGDIINTGTISPGNILVVSNLSGLFINSGNLVTFSIIDHIGFIIVNCGSITGPVLEPVADCTTDSLIELIEDSFLEKNVEKSLIGPIKIVSQILTDGNPNNDHVACKKLDSFISDVESKVSSGKLFSSDADDFIGFAEAIKDDNGCPIV